LAKPIAPADPADAPGNDPIGVVLSHVPEEERPGTVVSGPPPVLTMGFNAAFLTGSVASESAAPGKLSDVISESLSLMHGSQPRFFPDLVSRWMYHSGD
jgi:hypothetical protein